MALVEALRARGAGGGGFVAIEAEARATAGVHPLEWCLRPPRDCVSACSVAAAFVI